MKILERIVCIINLLYTFSIAALIYVFAAVLAFVTSPIILFLALIIIIIPIIIGVKISLKYILKKSNNLKIYDKILRAFPIINFLFLCLCIYGYLS